MKTAYLLFGLASAACGASPAEPQYPLCDRDGQPACGNIGQVGRSERIDAPAVAPPMTPSTMPAATAARPLRTSATMVTTVLSSAQEVVPRLTHVLVGNSLSSGIIQGPLVDHREEVVCGNVMTKGGSRRECRSASDAAGLTAFKPKY